MEQDYTPQHAQIALADAAPRADGVTALRRETKFALDHGDMGKVRAVLEMNCRPIVYNRPVSEVYSIYFDDSRLSSCQENLDGIGRRTKLRLRWYDAPLPAGPLSFEMKRREGNMTRKERIPLKLATPLDQCTYRSLRAGLMTALPEAARELLRLRGEPVVLIQYRRRHYAARNAPIRLTLDEAVRCVGQVGRGRLATSYARSLEGAVVLEVKAPAGEEEAVRRLLHPLRLRVTKSSKYVRCCQLLGWETGALTACMA